MAAEALPEMPDDGVRAVGRFEWERMIRRLRLGFYEGRKKDPKRWVRHAAVQQVAMLLATYGDLDGTRIRPSTERLATVCDLDPRTVRICIGRLRALQLLQLVQAHRPPGRAGGPGRAAEYRLTAPHDLLRRAAHLDPDEQNLIVPGGVDTPPERKPRGSARAPANPMWTPDNTGPVENP